ncbi:MAG: bifunctional folylpolyglutamate synthase/dihydrofolate synthase [Clostridia bacterium]|nr:bifunctional folylpolyglutamate synthase/dihydrofolate synthase [Clostridia bacterium]
MTSAEKYYHSLLTFGIMPGLDRIKILLERLGNPEKSLRCIHVAGTNGKGTVCSFLASVLKQSGYKTGLYTSPYIVNFRERIRIDGEMISETDLEEVTDIVRNQIEKLRSEDITITEFEAVTAAAFLYYKNQGCDFVVLETGLGGRFDATNVIERPLASVITSISLDHVNILGNTISEIAYEKCGIIKNGCPVVTNSAQPSDALKMIKEQSEMRNSSLSVADINGIRVLDESIRGSDIFYGGRSVFVPFPGKHQTENCITALTVIDLMKEQGIAISEKAVREGIARTKNPARCEVVSEKPLIILDGCHNEDSAKALCTVMEKHLKGKKITALIGMMADKDIDKVLTLMLPYFEKVYTVTPSNPRAIDSDELCEKIKRFGTSAESFKDIGTATQSAIKNITSDDVLIICGSLYLCSDVYNIIKSTS